MTRRRLLIPCVASIMLASCGGSNSAVTVETVTVGQTDTQATAPTKTQTATTSTPAAKTRTAPAPAFTGGTSAGATSSAALGSAVARLHALGFAPVATSMYKADQTLRVLIGSRGAQVQQAFFFNGLNYLGTDTRSPSAMLRVAQQSDTSVTLSYATYKRADALCCPTGPARSVRFQLDMGKLMAVDAIPSVAERR